MVFAKHSSIDFLQDPAIQESPSPFHAHVDARAGSLDGVLLATFRQRFFGCCADLLLAVIVWIPTEYSWRHFVLHEKDIHAVWDFHEPGNLVVMVLDLGLANYLAMVKR